MRHGDDHAPTLAEEIALLKELVAPITSSEGRMSESTGEASSRQADLSAVTATILGASAAFAPEEISRTDVAAQIELLEM